MWWAETAQQYALAGQLEEWVHAYLNTDGWNDALLAHLRREKRWWRGPLEAELAELVRICGPEPHMDYRLDVPVWERHVSVLQQSLPNNPLRVPPLIVECRPEGLIICDGAHRHEAMRRLGWKTCWVVIWYDTAESFMAERRRSSARLSSEGDTAEEGL